MTIYQPLRKTEQPSSQSSVTQIDHCVKVSTSKAFGIQSLQYPSPHFPGPHFPGLQFPGLQFPGLQFPGLRFPGLRRVASAGNGFIPVKLYSLLKTVYLNVWMIASSTYTYREPCAAMINYQAGAAYSPVT